MYSVLGSSIMLYSVCLAVSLFVCLPVCVRDSSVSELHVLCLSVSVLQQYSSVANKVYPSPTLRGGGGRWSCSRGGQGKKEGHGCPRYQHTRAVFSRGVAGFYGYQFNL